MTAKPSIKETKSKKLRTCRIYCDTNKQWIVSWYDDNKPRRFQTKEVSSKEKGIQFAKNKFDAYFDEENNDKLILID